MFLRSKHTYFTPTDPIYFFPVDMYPILTLSLDSQHCVFQIRLRFDGSCDFMTPVIYARRYACALVRP